MLILKFFGFFNSFFRVKNKNLFNNGFFNTIAFFVILKRIIKKTSVSFNLFFFKKKYKHISFSKAYFKYKTTKHSINNLKNKYVINFYINNNNSNYILLLNMVLNYKLLSIVHLNLNYVKINYLFKNRIFFSIFCLII